MNTVFINFRVDTLRKKDVYNLAAMTKGMLENLQLGKINFQIDK